MTHSSIRIKKSIDIALNSLFEGSFCKEKKSKEKERRDKREGSEK